MRAAGSIKNQAGNNQGFQLHFARFGKPAACTNCVKEVFYM